MSADLGGLGIMNDEGSIADALIVPQADQAKPDPEDTAAAESPDTGADPDAEAEIEASQADQDDAEDAEAGAADESGEEPDAAAEGDELFELVVDGETQEVSLSELRNGYLRQADYTKKRQADATAAKEFEGQREKFQAEAQQRLQGLDQLANHAQLLLAQGQRTQEQWEQLREEDMAEFTRERDRLQATHEFLTQVQWHQQQSSQEQLATKIPTERKALADVLVSDGFKDWGTAEGFDREYAQLGEFVSREFGITPEEWNGTIDHRSVRIAYHAKQNIEATRKAAPLKDKIKRKAKPAMRPGAPRQPEDRDAKRGKDALDRLRKSGGKNLNHAADALLG